MRMSSTLAALAAIGFTVAACGNDSNAPDRSHVGAYDMVSVDGQPLPVKLIDEPGYVFQVTDGSLTLNSNNTFVEDITSVETIDGTMGPIESIACVGSYTRRGSTITLTRPETDSCFGQRLTGTLSGSTLSVDYDGTTVVYSRQP